MKAISPARWNPEAVACVTSAIALGTTFHTVELIGYACIIATVFIIISQKKNQLFLVVIRTFKQEMNE